ncbi:hypothetical protein MIND_00699300 [Mycena indigotica]|uniref:Uncharacterized protein n=1 Tax=Mycena indigotica TaxID=2126181 RepID=A0A8H6SL02_9AGAR|nr:uncharacterized protein MIND_00699300 [Mycena indigotica]KAF7301341.1 hypothetical protein MIND_00699300 [Mycena indigotica]
MMRIKDIFRAFSSSSQEAQTSDVPAGNPIADPATSPGRRSRRLKRRPAKRATMELDNTPIVSQNSPAASHSTPNLLSDSSRHSHSPSARSWSSSAHQPRQISAHDSWGSYHGSIFQAPANVLQTQAQQDVVSRGDTESVLPSSAYGPRMEGLFSHQHDLERESPLTELASSLRSSQRRASRPLPEPPTHSSRPTAHDWAENSKRNPASTPILNREARAPSPEVEHQRSSGSRGNRSRSPGTYYIVPSGVNVIFENEAGKEITRVGDFGPEEGRPSPVENRNERRHRSGRHKHHREREDRHGRGRRSHSSDSEKSYGASEAPTIILIDKYGRQIPIMPYGHR